MTAQNLADRLRAMVARVEQDSGIGPDDPDLLVLKRIVLSVPADPDAERENTAIANNASPELKWKPVDAPETH